MRNLFLTTLFSVVPVGGSALAQQTPPKSVPIDTIIHEVKKIEPTEAHIARLKLPRGFNIGIFAQVENPRMIAVAPDGAIYVSQRDPGTLTLLKDTDGDGIADVQRVVAEKKDLHGIAIHENRVYFTTIKEVYVADRKLDGTLSEPKLLIDDLPDAGQHPNRTIAFGPDGMLYITVGSTSNASVERNPESATILRARPDGSARADLRQRAEKHHRVRLAPRERTALRDGSRHRLSGRRRSLKKSSTRSKRARSTAGRSCTTRAGSIRAWTSPKEYGLSKEDWARLSVEPLLMYRAHAAPLQMAYYTGSAFPAEYRNDAFIAMHGSWNRKVPSGYEVVRVHFGSGGRPESIDAVS